MKEKIKEGIFIDGKTAVCSCGGDVEVKPGKTSIFDPWNYDYKTALAYKFKCLSCDAFGCQIVFPFVEEE